MSLNVEDLTFAYGDHNILNGVSFQLEYGQFVSVLGSNGAGKSTLFRCMLGLLTPSGGRTRIDGRDVADMPPGERSRRIAYIPQSHSPVFNYSCLDVVLMGTTAQFGRFASPGAEQRAEALKIMERLNIDGLWDHGYRNVSGGERQLTLIARAMAQRAKIMIMDEPSSSLDFGNRVRLMRAIRSLTEQGYCVVQSTHDPDQAYRYSDSILVLSDGKIMARGTPEDVIRSETISKLYGIDVEVCSLKDDKARVCLPVEE